MDRKSLIILVVSVLVLFGLSHLVDHIFPPVPVPKSMLVPTNQVAGGTNASANAGSNQPAFGALPPPISMPMTQPSGPEQIVTVSNEDLIWHFTSHGGGIKTIELKDYPAVVARGHQVSNNFASLNTKAPVPVLALLGDEIQGDNNFTLTQNGNIVRAEKTLTNGLRLIKEFEIGTNYLFTARVRLENTSDQPLKIPASELVVGTSTPMGPTDDPSTLGTLWYNGVKAEDVVESWFANRTLGCIPGTPRTDYQGGSNNVAWAAVHNQFFTLAAMPNDPAPEVNIHKLTLPAPESLTSNAAPSLLTNGYEAAFVYPAALLAPHKTLEKAFTFYAGPKEYNRLAQIGQKMNNNLDLIMGFRPPFGFFSKFLLLSMNALHALGLGYAVAIIAITIIIKMIFWPLTAASTRSQKRLQALQPQLKAIADKYKDDPVKKNQKTMEFMKENKVNPMGSCLPMLLQVPVFIGFYWMLRNAIELRGVPFLWAHDLSQPDTVGYIANFPINPLPLIMGATQLWQASLMPPSPGMDPGQQKIMRYMPLMFIAIFYKMSAGLTLYWTVQNLLTIAQTRLTKKNITVDATPTGKSGAVAPRKKK